MIIDLIILITGLIIGFAYGAHHAKKIFTNILDSAIEDSQPKEEKNDLVVKVEKHGNMFYLYDNETDKFIIQGSNKEEIVNFLQKTFPSVRVLVTAESAKLVDFK